ncbi:DNA polymerase II [Candidatus Woesearchaeota archaeon]|nr:DNA polymerase II [Candidatus Woesearchaeota archaeon]
MEQTHQFKKKTISFFLEKDILLGANLFSHSSEDIDFIGLYEQLSKKIDQSSFLFLTPEVQDAIAKHAQLDVSWRDLEQATANAERGKGKAAYDRFLQHLQEVPEKQEPMHLEVVSSYEEEAKKRGVKDFVAYFNARFKKLAAILRSRPELQGAITLSRVNQKKGRDRVAFIGLVADKQTTKNGNLMLTLEDASGSTKVLINKNKPEVFEEAKDIVCDEVLGVVGVSGDNIVFANDVYWPDMPAKEITKSPEPGYAVFLSDLHVGSNEFLPEAFEKFIRWLRLETGSEEQQRVAKLVKYVFVIGDLVDGIGIYPGQDEELTIQDACKQYEELTTYLRRIPSHITLVVCPGNHDPLRLAEPQPPLYKDFAESLYQLPNIISVSNPSYLTIHKSPGFAGIDVLLYHGYSFDYYISEVDTIRNRGGYDRADIVMKFLLKRRHLAPTHTSTLYIPDQYEDPLAISRVPDIFVTGHIHKSCVSQYKHVTLISGSCFQAKTAFQEKVGHNPEPGRVPAINLQTREVKVMKFV